MDSLLKSTKLLKPQNKIIFLLKSKSPATEDIISGNPKNKKVKNGKKKYHTHTHIYIYTYYFI